MRKVKKLKTLCAEKCYDIGIVSSNWPQDVWTAYSKERFERIVNYNNDVTECYDSNVGWFKGLNSSLQHKDYVVSNLQTWCRFKYRNHKLMLGQGTFRNILVNVLRYYVSDAALLYEF